MEYGLSPLQWNTEDADGRTDPYWHLETGLGSVHLLSQAQSARQGPDPDGYAFAVFDSVPAIPGFIHLGSSLGEMVRSDTKQAAQAALGLGEGIVADGVLEIVWELLTRHSDPSGVLRWKPLEPTTRGVLELHLHGSLVKSERFRLFQHPASANVLETLRQDWRRLKTEVEAGRATPQHHQRVLTAIARKYRVHPDQLLDAWGEPWIEALEPATQINDNFNRTNASTLGTSSDGDWSWSEFQNQNKIESNEAEAGTNDSECISRADKDLSASDHYSQAKLKVNNMDITFDAAVLARKDGTATAAYYHGNLEFKGNRIEIWKTVNGTRTSLGTPVSFTLNANTQYNTKFEVNGSTLKVFVDDVEKMSVTNSDISGNLRTGILLDDDTGDRWTNADDFEAADLSAGRPPSGTLSLLGVGI